MSTNAERATELLDAGYDVQRAAVFALLAIADAIDGLKPPGEEPEPVPFEQTREGWKW